MLVLRRRLFWFFLALALFHFLFLFASIYLKAQIRAQNPGFQRFLDRVLSSVTGTGETYRDFMFAQGTVTMLLLGGSTTVTRSANARLFSTASGASSIGRRRSRISKTRSKLTRAVITSTGAFVSAASGV
jgi:hypothetical protein